MPPKANKSNKTDVVYKRAEPHTAQVNLNTYMQQVTDRVPPVVVEAIMDIYQDACNYCQVEQKDPVMNQRFKVFQKLLSEVSQWEEDEIDEEVERFKEQVPWLRDVLRQILVNQVHILLSMKNDRYITNTKFTFEMPSENEIVFHFMKTAARAVKPQARLFDHQLEEMDCETNLMAAEEIIRRAVERSVSSLVPIDDIVKAQYGEVKKKKQKKPVMKPEVEEVKEEDGFKEDSSNEEISEDGIAKLDEANKVRVEMAEQKELEVERTKALQEQAQKEQVTKEILLKNEEHIDSDANNIDVLIQKLNKMSKDDPQRAALKEKIKTLL